MSAIHAGVCFVHAIAGSPGRSEKHTYTAMRLSFFKEGDFLIDNSKNGQCLQRVAGFG